jgi:hypothetical protein
MDSFLDKVKKYSLQIAVVLAVFVILILVINVYIRQQIYNSFIRGHWVANEEFCKKSDLDGMLLQIGPSSGWWEERLGYLIMYGGGSIIINKRFNISIRGSILDYLNPYTNNVYVKSLRLADFNEDGSICAIDKPDDIMEIQDESVDDASNVRISKIMPPRLRAEIDIAKGQMIWYGPGNDGEDTIYAELYRDNIASTYSQDV